MITRIVATATLVLVVAAQVDAGQFGRFGKQRRSYSTPQRQSRTTGKIQVRRQLPLSPEKMTEIYGPSILIRSEKTAKATTETKDSRFVTQPTS